MGHLRLKRQLWQPSHDLDGAHAQFDDAQNQIEYIPRIIVFACPVVRVVYDAVDSQAEDIIDFLGIRPLLSHNFSEQRKLTIHNGFRHLWDEIIIETFV